MANPGQTAASLVNDILDDVEFHVRRLDNPVGTCAVVIGLGHEGHPRLQSAQAGDALGLEIKSVGQFFGRQTGGTVGRERQSLSPKIAIEDKDLLARRGPRLRPASTRLAWSCKWGRC